MNGSAMTDSAIDDIDLQGSTVVVTTIGAVALLVSDWVHFYLYFRGGYRGIAPDEVAGLTISRSFALNAIAAVVIAEALILGLRYRALLLPAAVVGWASRSPRSSPTSCPERAACWGSRRPRPPPRLSSGWSRRRWRS